MTSTAGRRKFWGWGYEDQGLTDAEVQGLRAALEARFRRSLSATREPPRVEDLDLPVPRLDPPSALEKLFSSDPHERASHAYGKSFRDLVRAMRGEFPHPPDLIAYPSTEEEVTAVLEWCADSNAAAIPYGGGSSVVGGVEPDVGDAYRGAVTVDLQRLGKVLEVDKESGAVRIQAGAYGPGLEEQLEPHGLALRHYPQSFEFSTLGGWIATRSGGHYATLLTHIEDFVESLRVITPRGVVETRRVPRSAAGPDANELFAGSEGILGVITEAWVRVEPRPQFRQSAAVTFNDFASGCAAARDLARSGMYPSNCRVLDPIEALVAGAGDGTHALLLLTFEATDHPVDEWMEWGLELCKEYEGTVEGEISRGKKEGSERSWRESFLRAPYLRDALVAMGVIVETFETSVTWDRFEELHAGVQAAVGEALEEVGASGGWVSARLTHMYPDGCAPYYTVIAPGRPGAEVEQWDAIKARASDAIQDLGGTITHHHAVGRDHRRWYDRERSDLFADALQAAKGVLDPDGIMNPGVLI